MFIEYWIEQYGQDSIAGQEQWSLIRFLADIIKNSSNPVVACTVDTKLIAFNTAFEKLSGYSAEELQGLYWTDLTLFRDPSPARLNPEQLPGDNALVQVETQLICRDGSRLPISYYIQAMRFPGDESTCYMIFITDISKQRQMQESLRYQAAFEELLSNISTRFINLKNDEIDNEIENTLRYVGEFVGADRAYLFQVKHHKGIMSNTSEWCAEGIESQMQRLQDLPLNEYSWWTDQLEKNEYIRIPSVPARPEKNAQEKTRMLSGDIQSLLVVPMSYRGRIKGFLGFDQVKRKASWSDRDIALLKMVAEIFVYALERKRASQRLDMANKMFDSISEAMMIVNPQMITWVNQAFTAVTGYTYDEIVGWDYWVLGIPEFNPVIIRDDVKEKLDRNNTWQGIIMGRHKDGHAFPAAVFVSAIHNSDNPEKRSYFVIFADITEQDRLNKERKRIKQQTAQLQRLNSLSALSGGMVHEIAQPLNSIRVLVDGMLYCHQNGLPLSNYEVFAKLGNISLELGRIDEIINHMRSFANLSNRPELEPCNWNQVVERSLKLLGRQLAAHSIRVTTDLDPRLPIMRGNLNRLDEVMVNLLVNAMQSLDLSEREPKEILCHTFTSGAHCCLKVADNGLGIDEEIIDQIFEPFVTTKSSYHGMGLGLSVVQSIMNALSGQVRVFNHPQGGAAFQLEIPAIV